MTIRIKKRVAESDIDSFGPFYESDALVSCLLEAHPIFTTRKLQLMLGLGKAEDKINLPLTVRNRRRHR